MGYGEIVNQRAAGRLTEAARILDDARRSQGISEMVAMMPGLGGIVVVDAEYPRAWIGDMVGIAHLGREYGEWAWVGRAR